MDSNRKLNLILKYIGNDRLTEINDFASEVSKRDFIEFSSLDEVKAFFYRLLSRVL